MVTAQEAQMSEGFDVAAFVRTAKNTTGFPGKVWVKILGNENPPDRDSNIAIHRASSKFTNGIPTIFIPSVKTIMRETGVDMLSSQALVKAGILEELCHLKYADAQHDEKLYNCMVAGVNTIMDSAEREAVKGKMKRLQAYVEMHKNIAPIPMLGVTPRTRRP